MNKFVFQSAFPKGNFETRNRLFEGDIYLAGVGHRAKRLVNEVIAVMREHLETEDIRRAHRKWNDDEFFERMGRLRRHFYLEPHFQKAVLEVAEEAGFEREHLAFDPIRIRVILPGGHNNPKAAPVYYPHRDTWYAHPQSLIVWWIPLHDLTEQETFRFYPDKFAEPVSNDSEIFDYGDWVKDGPALKIGWQSEKSGLEGSYPRALSSPKTDEGVGFACKSAGQLVFSGSHYHKTLEQDSHNIRYSLDFRIVDRRDIASNRGAPNVDNRSRGSTLVDYIDPAQLAEQAG